MNKLRRIGAIVTLSLTLAVSAFAGTIHGPGATTPPPPTGQSTSTTTVSTEILLTILGLIR